MEFRLCRNGAHSLQDRWQHACTLKTGRWLGSKSADLQPVIKHHH